MTVTKPDVIEVPDEWLLAAAIEAHNDGRGNLEDFDGDDLEFLSDGLAAAVPLIREAERAQIVEGIRSFTRDPDKLAAWCDARRLGAGAGAGAILLTIAREIEAGRGHEEPVDA